MIMMMVLVDDHNDVNCCCAVEAMGVSEVELLVVAVVVRDGAVGWLGKIMRPAVGKLLKKCC